MTVFPTFFSSDYLADELWVEELNVAGVLKWLKTTEWGARKVTPTRNERRRSA
jgi:hypothetical protein